VCLRVVGAQTSALDCLAGHVLVGGAGGTLALRIADESAVLVARAILEGALWLGYSSWADIGWATTRGIALRSAERPGNALDSDVQLSSLAAGSLERIIVVAAWGGKGASIVESSDHGDGNGFRRRVGDGDGILSASHNDDGQRTTVGLDN